MNLSTAASAVFAQPTAPSITAPLFLTDCYKLGHKDLYPAGTTRVLSNYTNRASRVAGVDKVVHFGLQAFLQSYCIEAFAPFFAADEDEAVAEYDATLAAVLGPDHGINTEHIRALHRLGYLPLVFCALPEGTRVPLRVPSFTVENTLPEFFWLTNYIETVLSSEIWQASTSATTADTYRGILDAAAQRTGGDMAAVNWQLHDFSFRGMAGAHAAAASGAGHLLSFTGSDSLATIDWVNRYYPSAAGTENGLVIGSIPATEHSVMSAGISAVDELDTYQRILDQYPAGNISVVSDTMDFWKVLTQILPALKEHIMRRDGKLVIRPDSGDPVDILCGTAGPHAEDTQALEPAQLGAVRLLWQVFGGKINETGFKELDPHIGLIYGDSITVERARQITEKLEELGFAASNVVLGVGSFTYQYVTRDTFSSAVKATWAEINGEGHNLLKDPVTDSGMKKSATGRLAVVAEADGELELIEKATSEQEAASLLKPVWKDGRFIRTQSFNDVRQVLGNLR
ncbi:nicotinate phosphoribosyltransferase [Glutamicibacter uratoxydans]|uniref:Nicotinamide phosphoribosyltransferase n=1 Tax=Glutamicibacter uratoxydans TaxID=43667 RepID=A0A4Y4DS50_GLUUR|nr:nicotinate phosphoribosyltransferase [Glutamicibacter uratoxydans]GED07483.1 nicotinate phosphoribosyltransferase [Glutamicibacter uratoxydans]